MAQQYQVDIVTRVVGASRIAQLDKAIADLNKKNAQVTRSTLTFEKSLQNLKRVSNSTAGAVAKTGAASATAAKGMRATGFAALSASGGVKSFGVALSAALGPIAAITGGLALFGKTLQVFSDRQRDAAVLSNGLKNLGIEGSQAMDALTASADKLGKQTLFDQEQFTRAYSLLTSFKSIGVSSYEEVATAASDMAQVTGQDLNSALLQLSKALEDPARRVTDLSRSGTVFTEQQKEQIKTLQQSGDLLGAQNLILQEIKAQYGGAALAAGKAGFAGAMDSLGESMRDLGENVGQVVVPQLTKMANKLTTILEKLNNLQGNKVFQVLVAPLKLIDDLGDSIGKNTESWFTGNEKAKESFEGSAVAVKDLKNQASAGAGAVGEIKTQADLAKEAIKALAAKQREYQAALGTEQGNIDRKLSVTQAILNAEKEINSAKLEQANADLKSAETQAERQEAAQRIFEATKANAKLQYESTIATAAAEVQKTEAALKHAQVLQKQYRAEVALAQSKGVYNDKQQEAINQANQLVNTAQQNLDAQTQIAEAIGRGAEATLKKQLEAARVTMEMQSQAQQQQQTNAAIEQGAASMSRLADEAQRAASASAGIGGGQFAGSNTSANYSGQIYDKYTLDKDGNIRKTTDAERKRQMNQAKVADANNLNRQVQAWNLAFAGTDYYGNATAVRNNGGMIGVIGSDMHNAYTSQYGNFQDYADYYRRLTPMATGGYVTGPTNAIVGEGGEPEYVIPASKMDSAMQRYGSGMRGSSVIPETANVSVNYNGSTVDMGGTSYINKGDVNGIVSQAVNATLTTLKKSPRARLEAGMR